MTWPKPALDDAIRRSAWVEGRVTRRAEPGHGDVLRGGIRQLADTGSPAPSILTPGGSNVLAPEGVSVPLRTKP